MARITCCTASWNAKDSLALMMESTRVRNPAHEFSFIILDNGSFDGAREYADRHADVVLIGDNTRNHGTCITECLRRAETEYVLTIDNDVFWLKPGGVDLMLERMTDKAFCVCPERITGPEAKGKPYGAECTIEWSPNVACGLFRTDVIQNICQHFHFGYYGDLTSERVYETGGLVWRVGQVLGLDSIEVPELWNNYMQHEGAQSTLWSMCPGYPDERDINPVWLENGVYKVAKDGYKRAQRNLATLRGCSVEELDEHEPPSKGQAQVIDLEWKPPNATHVKLIAGAGRR